ncbi:MAG: SapC family protein [Pseudomonadota bacterium]
MSKQQLFYETVVPVSSDQHGKYSIDASIGYPFTRGINSVPLMALEFPQAVGEYPIVFAQNGDEFIPVVILGARQDENLFLGDDNAWLASYVPAFIRRYPFVFSISEDEANFTLCVDESHPGFNAEGRGEALFTAEGKLTPYVENLINFLQECRLQMHRTQAFAKTLKELDLLEPMEAELVLDSGEKQLLAGFHAIDHNRLKSLSAETLHKLVASDELELIYMHLVSLRNFDGIKKRLAAKKAA